MRVLLCFFMSLFLSVWSQARMVGPYFGANWQYTYTRSLARDLSGNAGEGSVRFSGSKLTVNGNATAANNGFVDVSDDDRGHGLRLNFGYQMNEWFAWDLAYNLFADAEWETTAGSKAIHRQFSLDMAAVAMFPFMSETYATVRAGGAFLRSNIDFDGQVLGPNNLNINQSIQDQTLYNISGFLGAGVSYDISRYAALNFDVLQYLGSGKLDDATNYQIGLSYYFGR